MKKVLSLVVEMDIMILIHVLLMMSTTMMMMMIASTSNEAYTSITLDTSMEKHGNHSECYVFASFH